MKIKTSELTGAALDWAVAHAVTAREFAYAHYPQPFIPSIDWSQCGPLIESHEVEFCILDGFGICANIRYSDKSQSHYTSYLIAACRAIVASELGEEVDIPEELL